MGSTGMHPLPKQITQPKEKKSKPTWLMQRMRNENKGKQSKQILSSIYNIRQIFVINTKIWIQNNSQRNVIFF
jgi:hypothetical protein